MPNHDASQQENEVTENTIIPDKLSFWGTTIIRVLEGREREIFKHLVHVLQADKLELILQITE